MEILQHEDFSATAHEHMQQSARRWDRLYVGAIIRQQMHVLAGSTFKRRLLR